MRKREELIVSKEYILTKVQLDLYNHIIDYMKNNNINRTQLAEILNVTKGYISQILNGDFDHKISKLVELYLAIDKIPEIVVRDKSSVKEPLQIQKMVQVGEQDDSKQLILRIRSSKTVFKSSVLKQYSDQGYFTPSMLVNESDSKSYLKRKSSKSFVRYSLNQDSTKRSFKLSNIKNHGKNK